MELAQPPSDRSRRRGWAWAIVPPLVAAVLLFAVTELPYAAGRRAAPPGYRFDGLIAYIEDIHAYFSFVRQGAEGRWLFENRFAPESHAPVFFNLEWLLVGRATRLLGDQGVFVAWRAVGIALLVSGFWALTANLERRADRLLALAIFSFGGGFGWLAQAAEAIGVLGTVPNGELMEGLDADQSWGVQPFVQMLQNPHFSVAHGLVLIALGLLVAAERTSRTSAYVAAGVVGLLACASRPYELMAFAVVVPLLHLTSGAVLDVRSGVRRALTLVVLLPAVIPLWVIWRNPSFHALATQGVMPVVPLFAYAILLGVPAVVLAARVLIERRFHFGDPAERLMWIWGGTVLALSQANRFTSLVPYSPQILVTCMGPIVMLAVPALRGTTAFGPMRWSRVWITAIVLALALPSSVMILARRWREARTYSPLFVTDGERIAWEWLADRVDSSDVILATAPSSVRLPRHVPAHVVAGHWSLSPEYEQRAAQALAFFQGGLAPNVAADFVQGLGVDWIWLGPWENALGGWRKPDFAPGYVPCYERLGVRLYRRGG